MKKYFLIFGAFLALPFAGRSQCNNPFYEFKEGTRIFMQNFNGDNEIQGRSETYVKQVDKTANGYKATIALKVYNKDNEILSEGDYGMECDNGTVKMDLSGFVPAKSLMAFGNMEIKMEMTEMEIPSNLRAGQKLKDASLKISTVNSPITLSLQVDMKNRQVVGKETVQTPAGSFECYKLTYDMVMDFMMGSTTMKNVQYLTEKLGAVRTETYDSEGKLLNYTVLEKVEYP